MISSPSPTVNSLPWVAVPTNLGEPDSIPFRLGLASGEGWMKGNFPHRERAVDLPADLSMTLGSQPQPHGQQGCKTQSPYQARHNFAHAQMGCATPFFYKYLWGRADCLVRAEESVCVV